MYGSKLLLLDKNELREFKLASVGSFFIARILGILALL